MAHNARIRTDAGWAIGPVWKLTEITTFDNAMFAAVNGDGGGTWSPTSTLTIGGAGLMLIGATHTISGSASSITTDGASFFLTHGDSDYCELDTGHTGQSRSITSPAAAAVWAHGWVVASPSASFAPIPGIASIESGATARVPLRVHHLATMTTVVFQFYVDGGAPGIPATLPTWGVFAQDAFGNRYPLSIGTPYQTIATPATTLAWDQNGGQPTAQTVTFTCDAAVDNPYVVMDTTQFTYFAEITDAQDANAVVGAVTYGDALASFTNILDIHPG